MKRTQRDLMFALFEELVGADKAPLMKEMFEQQFLASFPNQNLDEEMTEEEYQMKSKAIRKEASAFKAFLDTHKFPPLPESFGTHQ
jgi:hypothetical protein